jgi:hypothetical protein
MCILQIRGHKTYIALHCIARFSLINFNLDGILGIRPRVHSTVPFCFNQQLRAYFMLHPGNGQRFDLSLLRKMFIHTSKNANRPFPSTSSCRHRSGNVHNSYIDPPLAAAAATAAYFEPSFDSLYFLWLIKWNKEKLNIYILPIGVSSFDPLAHLPPSRLSSSHKEQCGKLFIRLQTNFR